MTARVTVATLFIALGFSAAASAEDAALELKPSANPASPLAYDKAELTCKAGQKVKVTLNNNGGILPQPHNFILMKPGTLDKVGALANAMLSDPKAMDKSYIPRHHRPHEARPAGADRLCRVHGSRRGWRLSLCLHFPRSLAAHAWHLEGHEIRPTPLSEP